MSWRDQAACRGMNPDMFFPARGEHVRNAVAVCATCPVAADCLECAVAEPETVGVWAGTTSPDRAAIRRQRGIRPVRHARPTAAHGTEAGYTRHLRAHEPACVACRDGHRRAQQNRQAS